VLRQWFRDNSGVGEGVRHRDISLAGGPRNEISAGDKMSWAGFGGKWGGVSRSSLGASKGNKFENNFKI
jgi:hypothetical protein